ncbi:sensor histidine kinase [Isoalcanivorax indicus]|uniref:sensor histidine kinase n=1 Tax=Isoalcanivorax indicus TaxID=2202653 RepID=UPI000DBA9228|nr:hybrid sensor histidine kinase/response regulator [Isoalcanivorax indicus]
MNQEQPARILLVEDEPAIQRLFRHTYGEFDLITAGTLAEALQLLENEGSGIAVVLADHYLPDGTGVDVLSWARQQRPQAIRMLTTSHAQVSQALVAVNEGGVTGYILKPWELETLRQHLRDALRTYRERQQELALLEGKRQTLISLASSIAHEMRTPLATIRLRAEAIAEHWPMLMALYRDALASGTLGSTRPGRVHALGNSLDVIRDEVDRSNLVIDMLLASANTEAFDTASFAMQHAGDCVREALAHYPFEPGMAARVTLHDDPHCRFYGSDVLLVFVLYNLIKNACQALANHDSAHLRISLRQTSCGASLTFTDNGSGIAPEVLPRIFDDFYTTRMVGTGIGLAFCRRAMQAMGGEIRCRSRLGRYTSFRLRWPRANQP